MIKRKKGDWRNFLEMASKSTSQKCLESGGKVRPTISIRGKGIRMYASRYVWIIANGSPGELFVLHNCDNGLCVNIRHLYLGSQIRNCKDMFERKRHKPLPVFRGEKAHFAKLTTSKVKHIRKIKGKSQQEIAQKFGVSQRTISCILLRQTWKHI